jgi:hypothetical protein
LLGIHVILDQSNCAQKAYLVHLACGEVVVTCECDIKESLIVAQVKVGLCRVITHATRRCSQRAGQAPVGVTYSLSDAAAAAAAAPVKQLLLLPALRLANAKWLGETESGKQQPLTRASCL